MSEPQPRPILKLKLQQPAAMSPSEPKPATPKLKLKIGGSSAAKDQSPDVAAPSPKLKLTKPKKARPAKISTSKKRDRDALNDEHGDGRAATVPIKKLKFTSKKTPTTPYVKFRSKGRPPPRPSGVGYDSEASDREIDPAIEEEFILRMQPGDDCEYLRKAIEERNWGRQGAEVRLKFLQSDGRRAVVVIHGRIYAAILVDIPCIVEGMKSWDRKAWFKSADICQMLMVLGTVATEAEALNYPLPPNEVDKVTWGYAHGLTPPMRWARKRRFRKRISAHTIEEVEAEVERLLRMDTESAGEVKYELVDPHRLNQVAREDSGQAGSDDEEDEEVEYIDGEGEEVEDYFDGREEIEAEVMEENDDMAADFEAALEGDPVDQAVAVAEIPSTVEGATPAVVILDQAAATDSEDASTPAAGMTSKDEDSGDDDESDGDDEEDVDEDELEQRADLQRQREEIADLESAIKDQRAELDRVKNDILKRKLVAKIQSLEDDLKLKRAAIGEDGED